MEEDMKTLENAGIAVEVTSETEGERERIEVAKKIIKELAEIKRNIQLFAERVGSIPFKDPEPFMTRGEGQGRISGHIEIVMEYGNLYVALNEFTERGAWHPGTPNSRTLVEIIDDFHRGRSQIDDMQKISKFLERVPSFWKLYLAFVKSEQDKISAGLGTAGELIAEM